MPDERPQILALDLDGTLLEYDGTFTAGELGPPIKGMIDELNELVLAGWVIVIWTCRSDNAVLRQHLRDLGVPFSYVNDHPWNKPDGPRKIYADVYLDDKAMPFTGIAGGLAQKVREFKPWWMSIPWGS